jgi:hypothetical protein
MPITESFSVFAVKYHTPTDHKTQTFSAAESECFGKKTRFFKEETIAVSSKNLWKAMHQPFWEGVHPEPEAFFSMGKYNFAISKTSTPKSILREIKKNDRIVVRPKTMIGKRGNPVKNAQNFHPPLFDCDVLRYGTIISNPILETDRNLLLHHCRSTDLYEFRVVWDDSFVPDDPKLKNHCCKTFTLIKPK